MESCKEEVLQTCTTKSSRTSLKIQHANLARLLEPKQWPQDAFGLSGSASFVFVRESPVLLRQAVSEQRKFRPPTSLLELVEPLVSGHHIAPGDLCTQRANVVVESRMYGCCSNTAVSRPSFGLIQASRRRLFELLCPADFLGRARLPYGANTYMADNPLPRG